MVLGSYPKKALICLPASMTSANQRLLLNGRRCSEIGSVRLCHHPLCPFLC